MATIRKNLDTIVSRYVHSPRLNVSGEIFPPLYARVDNSTELNPYEQGMKDPRWIEASKSTYNSPTNIRRLFITGEDVTIQYHTTPIINGKPSSEGLWKSYKFSSDDNIESHMRMVLNRNSRVMEAAANGINKVDNYVASRTGLGAISNEWVMANIEEVYIDHWILGSEDIINRFETAGTILKAAQSGKTGNYSNDLPMQIFEGANGGNIKNIRTRFPRLRTIAIISNLKYIMASSFTKKSKEQVSELSMPWWKLQPPEIKSSFGVFVLSEVPESSGINTEFVVRPGIYRFDKEKLQPYAEKYKETTIELGRKIRDAKNGVIQDEQEGGGTRNPETPERTEKSELEKYLDSRFSKKDPEVVRQAMLITFATTSPIEIDKIFNDMSSSGGSKYRQMIGR